MDGVERVLLELSRFGIGRDDIVISTNIPTRLDGLPRSDQKAPDDPGVAVYWRTRKGDHRVMAIDRYQKVADNLAAVAATLDAMRAIERHGGAQILDRAFTGFTALPAPGAPRNWREVIGVGPGVRDMATVRAEYRRRAQEHHPDRPGGSHDAMTELNAALAAAEKELG
ncbi:J domain-containing protein [Trinickia mobilis]|uniref:J domain-containing protein n=1 Tax=Trinickia mobilis TaxID=2816356 RepID=UPI001A8F765E|nr:J domain-containing protein [Trinickia mobilis]